MERTHEDSVTEVIPPKREAKEGFFGSIFSAIKRSLTRKREGKEAPLYDLAVFALAFLFSRCHIIFGAYPVAIAFIAVLPTRVWLAVLGSAVGAITLGASGFIYAIISAIVAFLRIIVSATDKSRGDDGGTRLFNESIFLRLSSALIGGFIAAVYEILLSSLTPESALFGAAMIIVPPLLTYALSGLFEADISPRAIFLDTAEVFSVKRADDKSRYALMFFQCSALLGIFLISISLGAYELFGISAGFVFSGLITLFTARRFGAIRGAAVGFISSVGLSGGFSVAFTLVGIISGALASLGIIPAVLVSGAALSAWGAYVDGAVGFLSVFPEYAIAAAFAIPLFKKIKPERTSDELASAESIAEDMVGTMALSYKSNYTGALDMLESSFSSLSRLSGEAREQDAEIRRDELVRLVNECINRYFSSEAAHIPGGDEAKAAFLERTESIIPILKAGKKLGREDFGTPIHLSVIASGIADAINRAVGIVAEERYHERARDTSAEDFLYVSRLINEARIYDRGEKLANERMRSLVEDLLKERGITGYAVQVFGEEHPHIILALEDESGSVISSPELKAALEARLGIKLTAPEYYRKGKMALLECGAARGFSAESVSVGSAMSEERSGDTARSFETREERYYSLITDGMGSGEDAKCTSGFVADYLTRALEFGKGAETALRLLNGIIKRRRGECSATVDLFSFNLISGEALFYKCGSAPTYIRRGSSLFRIRSKTAPIGLSSELDAEKIRVELEGGDMVIMFSDGVSADGEAPWLLDIISRPALNTPKALSEALLAAAKKQNGTEDDISVLVTQIEKKA